jgi:LuxR family maltose regulon positive regulatory protein
MPHGARRLRLLFLGPPIVELGGKAVKLETKKATALLSYLSLRARGLRRDSLAALLWPEYGQTAAFANLRRTLASLNRSLPGGWLQADRDTVSLRDDLQISSDVAVFQGGVSRCRAHRSAERLPCAKCLKALEQSVKAYRGDFLEGLNLPDAPEFDDWQLTQRESLRAELGWALQRLVQGYAATEAWEQATAEARRWVALDRLHEPAQQALIELYARTGQKSSAVQQYEAFAKLLDDELGAQPEAETRELYNAAIDGRLAPGGKPRASAFAEGAVQAPLEPLLRTKVVVPRVRADTVKRPRLTARLNREIAKALILVSAPAGFGKTTLLASWAVEAQQPVAWVSLDPHDNDARRVLRTIVMALREVHPEVGGAALGMLSSPQFVPPQAIIASVLNELGEAARQTVLVLDEYQVLSDAAAQELIATLLDNPTPVFHLIIATRADPRLPLARLRARGDLAEFRAEELRFAAEEAEEFLNRVHGLNMTAAQLATLEERTEGWIAGLQMAALSMQGRRDVAGFVQSFSGSHRYILDYLGAEVVNRQPEDVQSFLLHTSMLRRLCGPLCDAVTGRLGDCSVILERLEQANLFVVPLDDTRTWYRYHRLFADLLLARLTHEEPGLLPVLHRRASEWFEQNGLVEEAIEHARAAKDHDKVIRLIEQHVPQMADGRQTRLPEWIGALPRELLERRPLLYLLQASGLAAQGRRREAEPLLGEAEKRIDPDDQSPQARNMRGQIAGLRAHFASLGGDVFSTIELTGLALQNLASASRTARATTTYVLARAHFTTGNFGEAKRALSECVRGGSGGSGPVLFVYALCAATFAAMLAMEGKLGEAEMFCRDGIREVEERGPEWFFLGGHVFAVLANILRERHQLEEAERRVDQGIGFDRLWGNPSAAAFGLATRARILTARGRFDSALEVLGEEKELLSGCDTHPDLKSNLNAALVELHLATGDPQAALHVAAENRLANPESLVAWREQDEMTYARALIANRRAAEALTLLDALGQAASSAGRNGRVIAILNLKALAYRLLGRLSPAVAALRRSLALACPERYVHAFVDEGDQMRKLLVEARPRLREELRSYVGRLLGVFAGNAPRPGGRQ